MSADQAPPSDRVRVRRAPSRGRYDEATVHAILDAGLVCHLGYTLDDQPVVVPTLYGREGTSVVVHGSAASRALTTGTTLPVCVTVTHLDGLVLARSLFNHSANYRSLVVLGQAVPITDPDEKTHALRVLTEHALPGRWDEARAPNQSELGQTTVLRLDLSESSAKVRTGPPRDDHPDLGLDVWAGELPVSLQAGPPTPDPGLGHGIGVPPSVEAWLRSDRWGS